VLWTRPGAPFLSIETWAGEPDRDGFAGELAERGAIQLLAPGATASHGVEMRFE
jgi:hypothetical protein